MTVKFEKSRLCGEIKAPPSKSAAHRMLLLAAISGGVCKVDNLDYSEDVLAMIDCLNALGAKCRVNGGEVEVDGSGFLKNITPTLNCRESGNTLRFLIPLCLTLGREIRLEGSKRLMERPQKVYSDLCREHGFLYKSDGAVTVCGRLSSGVYRLDGSVSSQFISGMIFALLCCEGVGKIEIAQPFESRSYVELTLRAIEAFGGKARFIDPLTVEVVGKSLSPRNVAVEGDYSNAAFLDAFNCAGGAVKVTGLSENSAQGDRIYKKHFADILSGSPEIDISDCPDLGPVLMAAAALNNGCKLTGTRRLAIKESDRGEAMKEELEKFGVKIICVENEITVPKCSLKAPGEPLCGHNDHRIVMSLAVMATVTGGVIEGAEAVRKTYPAFFEDIKKLGARLEIF